MAKKEILTRPTKPRRSTRIKKATTPPEAPIEVSKIPEKRSERRRCLRNGARESLDINTTQPIINIEKSAHEDNQQQVAFERTKYELTEREADLKQQELKLESSLKLREAQFILKHLEEYYQCPLCFEIIAHPFLLSTAKCGHTFCGICILKWFFSQLHDCCGSWHESVACPLCRSFLIHTPERIPRHTITIPFTLNRIAENSLNAMIGRLSTLATELYPRHQGRHSKRRGLRKVENEDDDKVKVEEMLLGELNENGVEGWADNGRSKKEWLSRENTGRTETANLIHRWSLLDSNGFIRLKDNLGLH